ncbi:MAG: hypothetical protein H0X38_11940, partial [Planctomycetes bacterium]|nr:hypothetical protein [Planctomycetota bacterium]
MRKSLSNTLLALSLAIAGAAPLAAATTGERDVQATAVNKLSFLGMRLAARRQLDEYLAAGYPDEGRWFEKILTLNFDEQFKAAVAGEPGKKMEAEAKTLRAELEAAAKSNTLPPVALRLFKSGGSGLERLAKDIQRLMHPFQPRPLTEYPPEKKDALKRMLDALVRQLDVDFKAAYELVAAHAPAEEIMLGLEEKDPKYLPLLKEAVNLRLDALVVFNSGYTELREAAFRGAEFGQDPKVYAEALKQLMGWMPDGKATLAEKIATWEFDFGESNPFLKAYTAMTLSAGVVAGVKGAKDDDVDGSLNAVINFDTKDFHDAKVRAEIYGLQFKVLAHALRWRLEQGKNEGYAKGSEMWEAFLARAKNDPWLKFATTPADISDELAQAYISAARLLRAKGDEGGCMALLAEVSAAHNSMGNYGKQWMRAGGPESKGGWSKPPIAADPSLAVSVAKSLFSDASSTADPWLARQSVMKAAVQLRDAVLGLNSAAYEGQFIEQAPQVYHYYALAMHKLEWRYQAALVSIEGARVIADRIDDLARQKKANPWRMPGKDPAFVEGSGQMVKQLVGEAYNYANIVSARNKAAQHLIEEAALLQKRIAPEDSGKAQDLNILGIALNEGNYEEAIGLARAYAKAYPEEDLRAFGLICSATVKWVDKLSASKDTKDKDAALRLSNDLEQEINGVMEKVKQELADPKITPARKKLCEQTQTTVLGVGIAKKIADGKNEEVIKQLDPAFWKTAPGDDVLSAMLVRQLAKAVFEMNKAALAGDKAKDPQPLLHDWPLFQQAYAIIKRQQLRLKGRNVDSDLRNASVLLSGAFSQVMSQADQLSRQPGASPQLATIADEAKRAFADLYEPLITSVTKPVNVLAVANTLWTLNEHERAAGLYEKYQKTLLADSKLQAFKKDTKNVVDAYTAQIATRAEFKKPWAEVVDLAWDSEDELKLFETAPPDQWNGHVRADYPKCLAKIADFRTKVLAPLRTVLGDEQYKVVGAALAGFEDLIQVSAYDLTVNTRLAHAYREGGDTARALPILLELFKRYPDNSDYAIGYVDAVLEGIKNPGVGGLPPKDKVSAARKIAIDNRNALAPDASQRDAYWQAYIQVWQLSGALGEVKGLNDDLSFKRRNKSDVSRDLIGPRLAGDDARVRRPKNSGAVQIAESFLKLYEYSGVTEKPSYRIDHVQVGGKSETIFVDADASAMEARVVHDADEDRDVTVFVAVGSPVAADPAPAPAAAVAAPVAAPAAPAVT